MSTKLQDFREQYPQYADWSDEELATALKDQYYPDWTREEFDRELGIQPAPEPPPEPSLWDKVKDTFTSDQEKPANVLKDEPNLADELTLEDQQPDAERDSLVDPYGAFYEQRQLDEAQEAKDPQDIGPTYGDQWHAGIDEYLANRNDAAGMGIIEDYINLEDRVYGRMDPKNYVGSPLGFSSQRFSRERRAYAASQGDVEAQDAILEELGSRREELIERLQENIDLSATRRERAAQIGYSPDTEEAMSQRTFFGAEESVDEQGNVLPAERGFVAEAWDDPVNIIMEIGIRSAPNMAEAIPLAIAGGATMGPFGFAGGMGLGSARAEYRNAFSSYLRDHGVDMTSARSMFNAAENEQLMAAAHEYSFKRSAVIGFVDGVTGGIATKTVAAPVKSVVARELMNLGAQTTIQAAGGAAGEAGAIIWSEGYEALEGRAGELGAEAIGELVMAPLDVGSATITGLRGETAKQEVARIEAEVEEMLGRTDEDPDASPGDVPPPGPPEDPEPVDPGADFADEEEVDPTDPEAEIETIIRSNDENWTVQVNERYPDGAAYAQNVTVTDRFGNTTQMDLKAGETFQYAVDVAFANRPETGYEGGPEITEADAEAFYENELEDAAEEAKAQNWAERNRQRSTQSGYPTDAELDALTLARARAGVANDVDAMSELAEKIRVKQNALLAEMEPVTEATIEELDLDQMLDRQVELQDQIAVQRQIGNQDQVKLLADELEMLTGDIEARQEIEAYELEQEQQQDVVVQPEDIEGDVIPPEVPPEQQPTEEEMEELYREDLDNMIQQRGELIEEIDFQRQSGAEDRAMELEEQLATLDEDIATRREETGGVTIEGERIEGEIDDRLRDVLAAALQRFEMEQQGQGILDDLEEAGRDPREAAREFWRDTYPLLDDTNKARFQRMIRGLGFKPGDVMFTKNDGTEVRGQTWREIADFINDDLATEVQYLEGTERGYVALMEWANMQRPPDVAAPPALPPPVPEIPEGKGELVRQMQAGMLAVRRAFPEADFIGPENQQLPEMIQNAEMDGVFNALVDWFDLTDEEQTVLMNTLNPPEPTVDTSRPVYVDDRLKRRAFRDGLQGMADEIMFNGGDTGALIRTPEYEGDPNPPVTGRVPSNNPTWFQEMVATDNLKMSVVQVQNAVNKAIAGKHLGVRQARVIPIMLDVISDRRTDPESLDYARNQLEKARMRRREARTEAGLELDPNADIQGEMFLEDEYDAEMSADSRIIFELMTKAEEAGVTEGQIERLAIMHENNQAFMDALEELTNEQRDQTGAQAAPAERGEQPAADVEETRIPVKRKKLTAIQEHAYNQVVESAQVFTGAEFMALPAIAKPGAVSTSGQPTQPGERGTHNVNTLTGLINKGYVAQLDPDRNIFEGRYVALDQYGESVDPMIQPMPPEAREEPGDYEEVYIAVPWRMSSRGEGDLYIQRVGPNAGRPYRTRQGPNDIAISFDQDQLLPDYMFHLLTFLQKDIGARARGTAQQSIRMTDIDEALTTFFLRQVKENEQLELYLEQPPDPSQAGAPRLEAAKEDAVDAVENLRSTSSILGREFAQELAAKQRTDLVGQEVNTVEDLAVLAQVYRDPRFETLRVFFTDLENRVVAQVGLTSRLPGSAIAIIGDNAGVFLEEMAARARVEGATGYYMQHNHPSGNSMPSDDDVSITLLYKKLMGSGPSRLQFRGHVVIDRNNYSFINPQGQRNTIQKDLGAEPFYYTGGLAGQVITSPETAGQIAAQVDVNTTDIVLIHVDRKHVVMNVSTMPGEQITADRMRTRRQLQRAALAVKGTSRVLAVGQDRKLLQQLDGLLLDAFQITPDGEVVSLSKQGYLSPQGDVFPEWRPPRISPDTSPAFDYLRPYAQQEKRSGMNFAVSPVFREDTGDLFGEDVSTEQAMADEIKRRDKKRNSGQESIETGDPQDLFSQASLQTDIEDVIDADTQEDLFAAQVEKKVEERKGRYRGNQEELTRAQRIKQMSMNELVDAIFTDELTGAGNLLAYNQEGKHLPTQAVVDLDALKWVNDNLGYDAGDAMLVAVATALDQDGVEVYRVGGDEFIVAGDNEMDVRASIQLAEGILANQRVETPKGSKTGLEISYGIARNKGQAAAIMHKAKAHKKRVGARAGRGDRPKGGVLGMSGHTKPLDMESGTNYVPMIGKHGTLPITAEHNLVLGNGRVVRIPKKPVRREHILAVMRKYFGNRIYEGRVKGKMRLGFYRPGHGEVRLRSHNDIEVAAHEIAHFLDDRYPWIRQVYMQHKDEMKGVSYDVTKVYEGYAEFMRLYFTQEWAAMDRAPSFYDAFGEKLKEHKQLQMMVEDVQELMHAWTMQGARARGASKMGTANESLWERFQREMEVPFAQGFLDGVRSFKRAEQAMDPDKEVQIAYQKARIALGGSNGVIEAAFHYGTPGVRPDGQGFEFTGEGLEDIFGERWGDHDTGMYLLAKRAQELMGQGRENLMRPDEIAAWLQMEEEFPELVDIHERYQAWNDRMLDFYVQMGILSEAGKAKMQEMNKNYVPFFRVVESRVNKSRVKTGGNPFQRLKGGTQNVNVIWENIINGMGMAVKAAMVNDAKRSLLRKMGGTDRLGAGKRNQAAGLYAAPISTDNKPRAITGDQVLRAAVEAMGWTMSEYRLAKEGMVMSEEDIAKVELIESMEQGLPDFVTMFEVGQDPGGFVDYYMDDGQKYWYEINDPALWDSLKFMGPKGTNLLLQIFGGFSATLRRGVVAWPTFQTKNFARDSVNAWLLSSNVKVPAARATRIIFERMKKDPMYQEMVLNGGGFANRAQGFEVNRKLIIDPTDLLARYDNLMGRFENANRLAEYEAARAKGLGPRESSMLSREISTDFAMRGSLDIARFLAIAVPFLNARVQGNYRIKRQFDYRQMAISYAMRGAAIAAAGLALYALNKDDERYKLLPEDIKDLYWVIFTGPGEDDYFLFPKPFESGMLFGTIPERMMEYTETEDGEEFADAMSWIFLQTFQMDMTPQIFQPTIDLARNKDFTGAPIIPFYLENVEPDQQFTYYTSETAKEAGEALGISPMKMDYMIRGYLGTAGTYMLAASDAMIRATTDAYLDPVTGEEFEAGQYGEKPTRGETWRENIIVKGLVDWSVNEGPPRRTKYVTDLYDMVREAETVANTMALRQKRMADDAEAYIMDPDNQFMVSLTQGADAPLTGVREQLGEIRKQMDLIRMNPRMTGDEKRMEIWNLTRDRNDLARQVMEAIAVAEREFKDAARQESEAASLERARQFQAMIEAEQVAGGAQ